MITSKIQYSLFNAEAYFQEHLSTASYYSETGKLTGEWYGAGAESLGLTGAVGRDQFLALCENRNPQTNQRLTQLRRSVRYRMTDDGQWRATVGRVFYDFTVAPPKAVSIAALIGEDSRILGAHDRAVTTVLRELERFAATRVHAGGSISDRLTANMVCAVFRHDTSRPLDPHLHSHCIVFNATHDPVELRWKALDNYEMLRARKYVEAIYNHEICRELRSFGYQIEYNARQGGFGIRGISQEICDRFSKRHNEIDQKLRELLQIKPELIGSNIDQLRGTIAQTERHAKIKGVKPERLRQIWSAQITPVEKQAIGYLKLGAPTPLEPAGPMTAEMAVDWAEQHLFERRSVVLEQELWRHALEHAAGYAVTVEAIQKVTRNRDYIRYRANPAKVTIREVLEREWEIVCMARDGIGQHLTLCQTSPTVPADFDTDQCEAVRLILGSRDFITLFRGAAGTGKSRALRVVHDALRQTGQSVQVVAPQRQQVADLETDGFTSPQTVSELLTKRQLPRNAVLICDEAGQIGGKQMHELLRMARQMSCRVILSGDTRQHGAVEASDALRAIEKYSGLVPAELTEIHRQDPALAQTEAERLRIVHYRQAVELASQGRLADSFDLLSKHGAIIECSPDDRQQRLVDSYLSLAGKLSTVIVSQTWSEIHQINEAIRAGLKKRALISQKEKTIIVFEPVDLTEAQKMDSRSYDDQSVIVFNRQAAGFKRGQTARLKRILPEGIEIERSGTVGIVPQNQLDRLNVCQPKELAIAAGDRLQLKANAICREGVRVANGELVTVKRIYRNGDIRLSDGRTLESDYRLFTRGYAITSYAAQGKTVDYVLFADSAIKAATNEQQWYVTISRGRRGIWIFTSDKIQLRENILRSGERELAISIADRRYAQRLGIRLEQLQRVGNARSYLSDVEQGMDEVDRIKQRQSIRQSRSIGGP